MLVGAGPFGVIFGSLVTVNLLAAWQGQFMSLSVFAGSSQFIALSLVASNAGLIVILFATFIVNLRHALYGATLLPHVKHLPMRWRLLLGFLLTDETFRSEEHTSELQSLMRTSYAVFCLKKKTKKPTTSKNNH